jgi:hypothetical protein
MMFPLLAILAATPVPEQPPEHHPLGISLAGGWNMPGGLLGAELDYRFSDRIAAGVAGGLGSWGPRLSVFGRLYFGVVSFTPRSNLGEWFLEPSVSCNFGMRYEIIEPPGPLQGAHPVPVAFIERMPTFAVAAAIGWAITLEERFFFAWRLGFVFRLRSRNVLVRAQPDEAGLTTTGIDKLDTINQHQGPMLGVTAGVRLF